jgi:CxxC-x17-CxxC domain-containing protein
MGDFRREGRRERRDFRDRDFGGRSRPFDNSRRGDREFNRRSPEMHTVVCDQCGEECQVPFKPTSSKPVYCSACFKGKEASSSRRISPAGNMAPRENSNSSDMKEINKKLDKIISMLEQFEVIDDEADNSKD